MKRYINLVSYMEETTMKKFLLGMVLTLVVMWTFGMVILGDNIKIERVEETHNRTVIEDGIVVNDSNWTEVLGYNVSIDLKDGAYIGR